MTNLPRTLADLDNLAQYYIEIDCGGAEASGYEDRLPWVCYGTIMSEGSTLEELLDNATVDLIDQDGGERGMIEAYKPWMVELIVAKWNEINSKPLAH